MGRTSRFGLKFLQNLKMDRRSQIRVPAATYSLFFWWGIFFSVRFLQDLMGWTYMELVGIW